MTLRAYLLEYGGVQVVVWETSPGRAKYQAAMSLANAGLIPLAKPSLVNCRRAREYDHVTTAIPGRCYDPDWLPT